VTTRALAGHTAACAAGDLPDAPQARDLMVANLARSGFDMEELAKSVRELALVGAKLRRRTWRRRSWRDSS
jgi:hypothetical protein